MAIVRMGECFANLEQATQAAKFLIGKPILKHYCPKCKEIKTVLDVFAQMNRTTGLKDVVAVISCSCTKQIIILYPGYEFGREPGA